MVDPSPEEHAPDRPKREFSVDHSYLPLPCFRVLIRSLLGSCVGVSRGSIERIGCAQAPPGSVDTASTSTSTPDLDCWSTLEPAIVGALTLPVQPNPFGAHPFQALRDVVMDAFPLTTVAPLDRPQHPQSAL